jgi:hypothetical protein
MSTEESVDGVPSSLAPRANAPASVILRGVWDASRSIAERSTTLKTCFRGATADTALTSVMAYSLEQNSILTTRELERTEC